MKKPIVGLLPLYLKLYDDTSPEQRQKFQPFLESVKKGFQERGVEAISSEICRLAGEFAEAVELLEQTKEWITTHTALITRRVMWFALGIYKTWRNFLILHRINR